MLRFLEMEQKFFPLIVGHFRHNHDGRGAEGLLGKMSAVPTLKKGPRLLVFCLPVITAAVTAFSTTGSAQFVSALMTAIWLVLFPTALYSRWAAVLLPAISAAFAAIIALALPLDLTFIAVFGSALIVFLTSFPRPFRDPLYTAERSPEQRRAAY